MRVVLNVLAAAERKTGVGHYTAELLRCLRRQAGGDQIESYPGSTLGQIYRAWRWLNRPDASAPGPAAASGPAPAPAGLKRHLAGYLRAPKKALRTTYFRNQCRRRGYDLYHEPNFIPLPCDLPVVVTVHDLSVFLHPEWHPVERVAYYERHFHRGLSGYAHVLAVSEFTRREVLRHFGLPPEQVSRTYNGVRPGLAPLPPSEVQAARRRLGLPEHYLLYVGTIEPRKNVLTLLRAYCDLPAGLRRRYPLVLAGGWGWGVAEVAAFLEGEGRHKGVIHLGYVADTDLAALYNGARALAYPSLYEGFGLPPVEMLACGGAVLASTAGAVAETAGSKAHLIEPLDVAGWRDALACVCTEDGWWQQLRHGAREAVRSFTWERCAADTLRVYRAVAGRPAPAVAVA
jgi:glycosyltransferase involved in cell wall biosynthesis